jgi:hypothetical protein
VVTSDVLDLSFQGMAVTIARGVLRVGDNKGEVVELVLASSETRLLLFSIYAFAFRIVAGVIPSVLIGAGLGRFEPLEVEGEKVAGRRR